MITIAKLPPAILELTIVGVATLEDFRNIVKTLREETSQHPISMLADVTERTNHAAFADFFHKYIAEVFKGRISRVAIVGRAGIGELDTVASALDTAVMAFDDKPSAIAWLRSN